MNDCPPQLIPFVIQWLPSGELGIYLTEYDFNGVEFGNLLSNWG